MFKYLSMSFIALSFVGLCITLACCGDSGISDPVDVTGTWAGSGSFTNNCENPACSWQGIMNPPSVVIELEQIINIVDGTVTLTLPQGEVLIPGNPCGPLQGQAEIVDGGVEGTRLHFLTMIPGGYLQEWDFNIISDNLQASFLSDLPGCTGMLSDNLSLSRQFGFLGKGARKLDRRSNLERTCYLPQLFSLLFQLFCYPGDL